MKLIDAQAEITRLNDLIEEQKGTITALNMALGGEDSTSTENLIDAHEVDSADEGLIALCRNLTKENVRLEDVVLFQKKAWASDFEELETLKDQIVSSESSPITEEVEDILRSENQNLFNALMESTKRTDEQAAEIARLKRVIVKCSVALETGLDVVDSPPERNCSCHLSPPCNDCVDYSGLREFFACTEEALAAIKEVEK